MSRPGRPVHPVGPEPASEDVVTSGSTSESTAHTATQSRHVSLGVAAAFGTGLALACQSRINGELGRRLGDGVLAALWSFGSGLLVLLVILALTPRVRRGLRQLVATVRSGVADLAAVGRPVRLRWWQCLGGLCGAFLVVTQSATVALIGVAVFTVAVVAGQAVTSLVVDRVGVGPGGPQSVTPTRIVGATLALGAVVLTVSDQLGTPSALALAILPALAGVGTAWQQAVNGRVAAAANRADRPDRADRGAAAAPGPSGNGISGALVAAFVNFAVGTTALLLAAGVDVAVRGLAVDLPGGLPGEPVLYLGGLCGVVFISLAAFVVRITGVLLLGLGAVAGQLVGALVLDGLVPSGAVRLDVLTVVGTLLTLVAVSIAALPAGTPARLAGVIRGSRPG